MGCGEGGRGGVGMHEEAQVDVLIRPPSALHFPHSLCDHLFTSDTVRKPGRRLRAKNSLEPSEVEESMT